MIVRFLLLCILAFYLTLVLPARSAHQSFRPGKGYKAELRIQAVGILSGKDKTPQSELLRCITKHPHHDFRQTLSPVCFHDIDIGQISKSSLVGDHSAKTGLLPVFIINADAERMFGGSLHRFERNFLCPVAFFTQKAMNGC